MVRQDGSPGTSVRKPAPWLLLSLCCRMPTLQHQFLYSEVPNQCPTRFSLLRGGSPAWRVRERVAPSPTRLSYPDDVVVRVPDVCLAGAALDGAPPALGRVDGLEHHFVSLGQMPAVAHSSPCLFSDSAQWNGVPNHGPFMKACIEILQNELRGWPSRRDVACYRVETIFQTARYHPMGSLKSLRPAQSLKGLCLDLQYGHDCPWPPVPPG